MQPGVPNGCLSGTAHHGSTEAVGAREEDLESEVVQNVNTSNISVQIYTPKLQKILIVGCTVPTVYLYQQLILQLQYAHKGITDGLNPFLCMEII